MTKSVGQVNLDLNLNKGNKFDNQVKQATAGTENAFATSMKKVGGFIAGAFAVKKIADFTKSAINSATQVQAAWTGLKSIADGTGKSFASAQNFIAQYTKDGLVSINEATSAYKNLLSRGYDTTQIENTMNALKDSAAFGRQASYDLGEAVVSATEGLKNENSILVDNAGVTKNVAKMWEDWANAHNTTTSAMTQAQKIEAEYNGILNETKFQTGDAATYTKTFGGQVQMLKMSFSNLQIAIGKVVAPIAQLFIPAINSALAAITNFFVGIQSLLKTFGISFPDVVSKSSKAMSSIGGSAVDTASDIASTGDAATKAAKKINRAFGSVDEINVLNTKQTDSKPSSGATTDTGVAGVDIVPEIADDNVVSKAVSGTVDKIMKYINPLKNIKFDNLINSFTKLKKSIEPIINTIGHGLEWFYFNILVPLAKWTIEDILPSFLNILAGAFNILNTAITDVQPLFSWLWESFLMPIATWTGGVIVDVLNGIGNALKWVSDNEIAMAILEGIAISIGLVSSALTLYTTATKLFTAAKAAETKGLIANAIIWATANLPIIAVTLAIGALIAIIILCIKHWDDIKAAAIKCWEMIKSAWEVVATWFNNTVIEPIKNFFGGMWESLKNGASNAWNGIKTVFSNVASFFKNIFTDAWEGVKKVFSVGGRIFDGIKDGIVSAFTTIVNTIINGINKVVAIPFNGINSALDKIKNINILGAKPFDGLISRISVPQLPMLAQGGYAKANDPQLAIIGDNTREGEIVSPESKIYDQAMKAIKDSGGTGGTQQLEITIYHKYEDGRTIIQKVNQAQIDAGEILLLT